MYTMRTTRGPKRTCPPLYIISICVWSEPDFSCLDACANSDQHIDTLRPVHPQHFLLPAAPSQRVFPGCPDQDISELDWQISCHCVWGVREHWACSTHRTKSANISQLRQAMPSICLRKLLKCSTWALGCRDLPMNYAANAIARCLKISTPHHHQNMFPWEGTGWSHEPECSHAPLHPPISPF